MLGNFEPDRRQFKDLTTFAMLVGERFANLVHGRLALRASVRLAEPMLDDVVGIGDALEGVSAPPLLSARFAPGLRPVCARFAPGLRPVCARSCAAGLWAWVDWRSCLNQRMAVCCWCGSYVSVPQAQPLPSQASPAKKRAVRTAQRPACRWLQDRPWPAQ